MTHLSNYLALAGALALGFAAGHWNRPAPLPERASVSVASETEPGLSPQPFTDAFARVARDVGPAVVRVSAGYVSQRRGFRRRTRGSGVVLRENGIIVTNNHVVAEGDDFFVEFTDGRREVAELVGTDADTDLAVLRVDLRGLSTATLAADDDIEVGEWVLAFGNPLGRGHTVTHGIVSGLGRGELNIAAFEDFLQTDAAINPGNSGGALVNLEGQVVGLNTAVGTEEDGTTGISYAIPTHMIRHVVDALLREGRVRRGFLGVRLLNFQADGAPDGYARIPGIRIAGTMPDTPAESSDIEAGDVVLAVGGERVQRRQQLMTAIAKYDPNAVVTLRLWRGGREFDVSVQLVERTPR